MLVIPLLASHETVPLRFTRKNGNLLGDLRYVSDVRPDGGLWSLTIGLSLLYHWANVSLALATPLPSAIPQGPT